MAVRRVEGNLERWLAGVTGVMRERMEVVARRLKEWARAEQGLVDRTGELEAGIDAYVLEASMPMVRLEARMDPEVFADLAREGRWAFLWPVITRHADDIRRILNGELDAGRSRGHGLKNGAPGGSEAV